MEQNFYKYSSIENSYQSQYIDKIKEHGFGNITYCATEKIHGSNTQVYFDGVNFLYGSRNHYLEENEKCYNLQDVVQPLKASISNIYKDIDESRDNVQAIIVFGEVFGGSYPHPDVQKVNNAIKVQKGVFYSPDNHWLVFDIQIIYTDDKREYISFNDMLSLCRRWDLPYVPFLAMFDSLDEALKYPNDGPSQVYKKYNLPALEDNVMEGVVIKPFFCSPYIGQSRLIIKNKNEKFVEKSRDKKVNIQQDVPEHISKAIEEISKYITENRVVNIVSHYGQPTFQDIGPILQELNKDIIEEFNKETGILNTLEKKEVKMVTKSLNAPLIKLVKKEIMSRM